MDRIDRKEFINEIMLREHISKSIRKRIIAEKYDAEKQQAQLRKLISSIIKEEVEEAPHRSTGINVLAGLLKKIIPVIEQDYKQLTTDPAQRESYRSHIINATQNTIAPLSISSQDTMDTNLDSDLSERELEELEKIEVAVGDEVESVPSEVDDGSELDDEAFIDINGTDGEEIDTFGIEGKDTTGRNFAQDTFGKIETQISDAYTLLSNDEDKNLFYSYLITNLKLYFDKFEDELASVLPEPTTDEYENEKDSESDEDNLDSNDSDEIGDEF